MKRLFLLLLFLPPVAGPAEAQRTRPGTDHGDSLRGVVSREFELYAPTDEEIRGANDDIRIAIAQFKRYMGEHPRKMAFVLFRSAADAARYDYRRFTRSETPVVSWVVGPKPRDVSGLRPPGEGNPDPVSHQAGHRFMIAYVEHMQPLLRAAGLAPAETAAVRENDVSPGSVVQHPDHPAVPDWLEEAIAALCERPASQSARLDLMRANLDRRIPIQELLAMSRPDGGRRAQHVAERALQAGRPGETVAGMDAEDGAGAVTGTAEVMPCCCRCGWRS